MYLKDAKKACPELCIVNGEDLTHYRDMSYKITGSIKHRQGAIHLLMFLLLWQFLEKTSKASHRQGFTLQIW